MLGTLVKLGANIYDIDIHCLCIRGCTSVGLANNAMMKVNIWCKDDFFCNDMMTRFGNAAQLFLNLTITFLLKGWPTEKSHKRNLIADI